MSKKLTTEQFIEQSKVIHGNKYDYSKTEYKGIKTKVCITCPKHGDFYQIPDNHLRKKYGCPKCGRIQQSKSTSYTWAQFLLKARCLYEWKYDYSLAKEQYKNQKSILTIICPVHGLFKQAAYLHLHGGCEKCGIESAARKKRFTTEEFIKKAQKVHNNKYDYSNVDYYNSITPIKIICPKHGEFEQIPNVHLTGCGCPKCKHETLIKYAIERRTGIDKFIQKAITVHGNKYNYSQIEYINEDTPIKIICPEHGEFWQRPSNHLAGKGCQTCKKEKISKKLTKTQEQFIKEAREIHGDKYDYSQVKYVDSWTPVTIICPEHGLFYQKPIHHIHHRNGCPKCKLKAQTKVFEKLIAKFPNENILFEVGKRLLKWLGKQRLDIYFPDYNIAIEYDGKQHFTPVKHFGGILGFEKRKTYDKIKEEVCAKNNCHLFRLKYNYSENDFNNLVQQIKDIINL